MKLLISSGMRLSYLRSHAKRFSIDENSKIVLMSDIHRGGGGRSDTFIKNQLIYSAALTRYDKEGYTYIELGDGDELWKNKKVENIIGAHKDIFWRLGRMYRQGRFVMMLGNHDIEKKSKQYMQKNFSHFIDPLTKQKSAVFGDMPVYESVVLDYNGKEILLLHGHQVDPINNGGWRFTRFMVRYVWRPLEAFGISDPTSAAINYHRRISTEAKLIKWVNGKDVMLITGHTHRPAFPAVGEPLYFNCGSGVNARTVTATEIKGGKIRLVKWSVKANTDGSLYVGKDVLAGPQSIKEYFQG